MQKHTMTSRNESYEEIDQTGGCVRDEVVFGV